MRISYDVGDAITHIIRNTHGTLHLSRRPCGWVRERSGPWNRWYNQSVLPDLRLQDVLMLRKAHPCGGNEWKVIRLGADIGLECLKCKRQVLLPRRELAHRLKKTLSRGPDDSTNA